MINNKEIKANRKNLNNLLDFIKKLNEEEFKKIVELLEKW